MDTTKLFREDYKVRANEVGNNGKITIPAVCGIFQEIAGNHALELNFDITHLQEQGLTWVLHRMDIKVNRYPEWRENITVETWPAAGDALRAYRNYRVLNSDGEEIIVCLSYWMMINMKTRRPSRMPQEILDIRLADIEHVLEVRSDKIPKIETADAEVEVKVRRSDLDMNLHVNNVRFLEWMEEPLNEGQLSRIKNVDIIFSREAVQGDIILSKTRSPGSDTTLHQLENQRGEIVAQGRFGYS